jgi:hypothetical protein
MGRHLHGGVGLSVSTSVSEEHTASIYRTEVKSIRKLMVKSVRGRNGPPCGLTSHGS